jgi:hypothetical protein
VVLLCLLRLITPCHGLGPSGLRYTLIQVFLVRIFQVSGLLVVELDLLALFPNTDMRVENEAKSDEID